MNIITTIQIVTILVAIITLSELLRFYMVHKKPSKKDHFKLKSIGTKKMIWDLEFKKEKTLGIKEDIRKEFDYMKSSVFILNKRLEKESNKDTKANLVDQKEKAETDIKRLEMQMAQLDVEVFGMKKSKEYPNGAIGITEQINNLEELADMIEDWAKKV